MMLAELALNRIEKLINTYFKMDPHTQQKLQQFSGKNIEIAITGFPKPFYVQFLDTSLQLSIHKPLTINTTITGLPFSLLYLICQEHPMSSLTAGDVKIEGDLELAQNLQSLLKHMDIDWEEHLSHYIGDIPAHQLGHAARRLNNRRKIVGNSLRQNLTEYLQEELRALPPREEIQDFMQDVDELRLAVDRLSARISQLNPEEPQ